MRMFNVVHHDNHLTVAFADQTQSIVDTSCLIPAAADEPQWHDLTFTDYEIIVPVEPQTIEISWLTIWSLTDPEFDAYLGEQARQEATRIGRRLQEICEDHKLSRSDARIPPTTLKEVEQGHAGLDLNLLATILSSMDASLDDLALPSSDVPEPASSSGKRSLAHSGCSR